MTLETFNRMEADAAAAALRPCVDNDAWVEAVVAARPFATVAEALAVAERQSAEWTRADVDRALAHHPRIGERAAGDSAEASMSRSEQSGTGAERSDLAAALVEGNRAYEERFGRVFLIRAAGRSAEEILSELDRRLGNAPEDEAAETAQQLREIALIRLEGVLSA